MTSETVDIFQEAILVVLRVGGPILLLCMAVGVFMAILQAVTQVHEQSIAFVMKLTTVTLFLLLGGGWMLRSLTEFAQMVFGLMT